MQNLGQNTSFIWSVVDPIRDSLKNGEYQDVTLPVSVLRPLGMRPMMVRIPSRRETLGVLKTPRV